MNRLTRTKANGSRGRQKQSMTTSSSKPSKANARAGSTYTAGPGMQAIHRIRSPNPTDVLCGRGGSINSHHGNKVFREWVHQRKNAYNLAVSKQEKAAVSRHVIEMVQAQKPPGKFLMRDPSAPAGTTWWIEIDDAKAMAKTSQALREGAPAIRSKYKHELDENKKRASRKTQKRSSTRSKQEAAAFQPPMPVTMSAEVAVEALRTAAEAARHGMGQQDQPVPAEGGVKRDVAQLAPQSNDDFQQPFERPAKVPRVAPSPLDASTEATPPLLPVPEPPRSFASLSSDGTDMKRTHSLALSDISVGEPLGEFVNPFDSEHNGKRPSLPQTPVRSSGSSTNSVGELSIGSLLKSASSSSMPRSNNNNNHCHNWDLGFGSLLQSPTSQRATVRKNASSRLSMSSELSDLPDPGSPRLLADTDFNEGLKMVRDAVTSPEDETHTHLYPFKGGSPVTRRLNRAGWFATRKE